MRSPVTASKKSWTSSRSLKAQVKAVPKKPTSVPNAPANMRCDSTRLNSERISRTYSARSGASTPASRSVALTYTHSLQNAAR